MLMRLILATLALAPLAAANDGLADAVRDYLVAADEADAPASPWTVTGALGVTLTDGNSETLTAFAGIEGIREGEVWKLLLKFTAVYAESTSSETDPATGLERDVTEETANEEIFTERLERALSKKGWIFQELIFEHDEQEELNYRLQFTVGYRRLLKKSEKFTLFGEFGAGVVSEDSRNRPTLGAPQAGDETNAILHVRVDWRWQLTEQLLYTQVITYYPTLGAGGDFRVVAEAHLSTPVSDRLNLKLSIIDQYVSDPDGTLEKNDLTVTLTLTFRLTKKKS